MSQTRTPYQIKTLQVDGVTRNVAAFECDKCDASINIILAHSLPPDVIVKKVHDKGWVSRKSGKVFVCPTCKPRGGARVDTRLLHGREPVLATPARRTSASNVPTTITLGTVRNANAQFVQGTSIQMALYVEHLATIGVRDGKRVSVTFDPENDTLRLVKADERFLPSDNSVIGRIQRESASSNRFFLRVTFKTRTLWAAHLPVSAQQRIICAPDAFFEGESVTINLRGLVDHSPAAPTPMVTTDGLRGYAESEPRVQLAIDNVQADYERLLVSIAKLDGVVKDKQGDHAAIEVYAGATGLDFKIGVKF